MSQSFVLSSLWIDAHNSIINIYHTRNNDWYG